MVRDFPITVRPALLLCLAAMALPALGADAPTRHTVDSARYYLSIPDDYGPSPNQRKALDPVIRQCGANLASMKGLRKGDNWYDFKPAAAEQRSILINICAAYQVGLAEGIAIGSRSTPSNP